MYLKQLKITNFKSFFETTEFDFEPGFNVLLGANSRGKTSVLEAICFHELASTPHRSILNATEIDTQISGAGETGLWCGMRAVLWFACQKNPRPPRRTDFFAHACASTPKPQPIALSP